MNKKLLRLDTLLAGLFLFIMIVSCSSSENTVVIEDAPIASSTPDSVQQTPSNANGTFEQLTIGENQPIHSLDPLFIENASEMHATQLVYEGLVQYDEKGQIVPAVAKDWKISDNQRTYQISLKGDLFYHDSDAFNNGRGRRLVAADVKEDFERMAKVSVPDLAAQFFMNIEGFEPYYQEQHHVVRVSDRQLNGVNGIEAPNDSTVIFHLVKPDDQFIQKLATPYAVIYPQEAVTNSGFKAVGTGPFRLSQQRTDSLYIFSKFDNYRKTNQPKLDRVDIVTSSDETKLLNALSNGNVQLIPKLGPQQMQMVSDANGQLKSAVSDSYKLTTFKSSPFYRLQYNSAADITRGQVTEALSSIQNISFFSDLPQNAVQFNWSFSNIGAASKPDSMASTYSADPVVQSFYQTLSDRLKSQGIPFRMSSTRVATRNTPLSVTPVFPLFEEEQAAQSDNTLATFNIKAWALVNKKVDGLKFNNFAWWLDLRDVTISSTNR